MKKRSAMKNGIVLCAFLLILAFTENVYANEINYYKVTISVGEGGSVDGDTEFLLPEFTDLDITFLPDEGYLVDEVLSDGTLQHVKGNIYRISDMQEDMYVEVTFKLKEFAITFYENGGTMYQENQIKVKYGQKIVKPLTPVRAGYIFEGWYGTKDLKGQTYNFNALVYADKQLYAKWSSVTGWHAIGSDWYFYHKDGSKIVGWMKDDGKWYYFNKAGVMQHGWQMVGKEWYYLSDSGAMRTGWINVSGKSYYLDKSGVMQRGWKKIGGRWYYLNSSGSMRSGWMKQGEKWYYLNDSGVMQSGWTRVSGKWYYLNKSGVMQRGWVKLNGKWYYFNDAGVMQTEWMKVNGQWYYFNGSGAMQTGWLKMGGKWYYLKESGAMASGSSLLLKGKTYKFNESGMCTNP